MNSKACKIQPDAVISGCIGYLLLGVEDVGHRPLHVGLSGTDPNVSEENIFDGDFLDAVLGDADLADFPVFNRLQSDFPGGVTHLKTSHEL